jgi:lambda repressor-like predicted transcriptional regulator
MSTLTDAGNREGDRVLEDRGLQHEVTVSENLALRNRMAHVGLSKSRLASITHIDERSIQRWLDGEVRPHAKNAELMAEALDCEQADLWPKRVRATTHEESGTIDIQVFASRAHVPVPLWIDLLSTANEQIDICVYGGTFLFDTIPGFTRLLGDAAARGVAIRFLVGDPASDGVKRRGEEEDVGTSLPSRCALTLDRLRRVVALPGFEIRVHGTTLYASIFRIDYTVIANHHIYGSPASDNPAILLSKAANDDVWRTYAESFDKVWLASSPVTPTKGKQ